MISASGVKRYCESVFAAKPIYLWGADMQVLTEAKLAELRQRFGAQAYKDIDLAKSEGLYGADCSGMLTPISGKDMTASGYYVACETTGPAAQMPLDKTCLLFREETGKVVHVAVYTGDGVTYEMWDGCQKKSFDAKRWSYYGIPAWIEQHTGPTIVHLGKATKVYRSAQDALTKSGYVAIYPAGDYYLYKEYKGASNITKHDGVPGGWCVL